MNFVELCWNRTITLQVDKPVIRYYINRISVKFHLNRSRPKPIYSWKIIFGSGHGSAPLGF